MKKVPSTSFHFAENFPQALVYADKYLRQQQSSMNMYSANQQDDEEGGYSLESNPGATLNTREVKGS